MEFQRPQPSTNIILIYPIDWIVLCVPTPRNSNQVVAAITMLKKQVIQLLYFTEAYFVLIFK